VRYTDPFLLRLLWRLLGLKSPSGAYGNGQLRREAVSAFRRWFR